MHPSNGLGLVVQKYLLLMKTSNTRWDELEHFEQKKVMYRTWIVREYSCLQTRIYVQVPLLDVRSSRCFVLRSMAVGRYVVGLAFVHHSNTLCNI